MSGGQIADIEFININPGHGYGIGNYDATILSDGEIVPFLPVPEPATTAAGAALVVLAGLAEWRRRRARLT
jgi:MYXO-CTERM domain-containing protein